MLSSGSFATPPAWRLVPVWAALRFREVAVCNVCRKPDHFLDHHLLQFLQLGFIVLDSSLSEVLAVFPNLLQPGHNDWCLAHLLLQLAYLHLEFFGVLEDVVFKFNQFNLAQVRVIQEPGLQEPKFAQQTLVDFVGEVALSHRGAQELLQVRVVSCLMHSKRSPCHRFGPHLATELPSAD